MSKYTYSQECFRLFYIIKVFVVTSYFVCMWYQTNCLLLGSFLNLPTLIVPYSQPVAHNKPFVAKHSICLAR